MQLHPYLFFNGNCQAAFEFYEQCLGGKALTMMLNSEAPAEAQMSFSDMPADWPKKIMHARLEVGDWVLMGSDCPPHMFEGNKGFSVNLSLEDAAAAERIFHHLAENGEVRMPIQQTFWAFRFGMLVDRFGIPWMVNCEKES